MNLAPVPLARAAVALVLPIAIIAGCATETGPSAAAGSISPRPEVTATSQPPASTDARPSPTAPDDASPIVLDASLLGYLPVSVGEIAVSEDADEATAALSDPTLSQIAAAVDGAVAVDAGSGNLVFAWIVRLRAGALTESGFRDWRDTYDGGACAAGGGIVGHAEATIGGRPAYVTTCVSGMRTYHVWLQGEGVLISASAIGDGRFGEKLIEGIRVP